jgi:diguanylate cyclase (GGDEF)-like protein/PAS domain S-box-containing protein
MTDSNQQLTILHLDDTLADAELVEHQLRSTGLQFRWHHAADRDAFIWALEEFRPDVVLADYLLPGFDGLAAIRLVHEQDADLPVILVTGMLGDEAAVSAIKAGATDFVLKDRLARLAPAIEKAVVGARQARIRRRTEESLRLSEERFRSLIATIAEIVWTTDTGGQMIEDDPGWRAYTGQTSDELKGAGWLAAVHPDSREEAESAWIHAVAQDVPYETEWRLRRRDGEYRCFSIRAAPVRAGDGAVREWIGCNIDITDRKQRDEELKLLHAKADAAVSQLERQGCEMHILKNLSDTLQACNSREEAYPFVAMAATELFSGASGALAVPATGAQDLLETATEWGGDPPDQRGWMKVDFAIEDCWALRRGAMHEPGPGTVCHHFTTEPSEPYVCLPLGVRGEVSGLLCLRLPNSGRLDAERQSALSTFGNAVALGLSMLHLRETLQQQSIRDPLTGLAGAGFSDAVLGREIKRAERHRGSLSLAVLGLDGFSQLKEAHGPRATDALLCEVAAVLRSALGPLDLAARYDGHQLLLLLIGDEVDKEGSSAPLARLRRICLDIQHRADAYQAASLPRITVSAGLAEWPVHGATAEELMRAANQALRAATLDGSGSIEMYSPSVMPAS